MTEDDPTSMKVSNIDLCAETIIIITGLNQADKEPELIRATKAIAASFYNTIVVNYNTASYVADVENTAAKIVRFIESLERYTGVNRNHLTLIGISLGAHVAGAVGKRHRVSRILALDPSGPVYDWLTKENRLDSSDADFVDVVHSSNIYGTKKFAGHVNFIINGGRKQPNCKPFDFSCHHLRAAYVFLASVTSCEIYFRQCFAYWAFKAGLCNKWPRLKVGLDLNIHIARLRKGRYYYDTSTDEFPYCSKQEQKLPKLRPLFC